ncbi:MAG: hypothetical protein DCE90_14035 [Pseudanabaena sp.]|nr:MAG: hypothetical protein DCE90_14035 [Pseudanabaena sp.]
MATSKKENRFIGIDPNVAFKLNLDPDIYNSQISPLLGMGNTLLANQKQVDATIQVATKNGHCVILKCTVQKGEGINQETRQIELICDVDNADTAPSQLIGKTVKLGYKTQATDWEVISAYVKG